jgi:hypothetical protein
LSSDLGAVPAGCPRLVRKSGDGSGSRQIGQSVSERPVTVLGGVLVTQGGCRARMARTVHELGM